MMTMQLRWLVKSGEKVKNKTFVQMLFICHPLSSLIGQIPNIDNMSYLTYTPKHEIKRQGCCVVTW